MRCVRRDDGAMEVLLEGTEYGISEMFSFYCNRAAEGMPVSELSLPQGIEVIAKHAFEGMKELEVLHLPDSLTELGDDLFQYGTKRISHPLRGEFRTMDAHRKARNRDRTRLGRVRSLSLLQRLRLVRGGGGASL